MQYTKEARKDNAQEYRHKVRNVNKGQRNTVMCNWSWCKVAITALRKNEEPIKGYQILMTGSGGTDKIHEIDLNCRDVIVSLTSHDKL